MQQYLFKRILVAFPVLVLASIIVFTMLRVLPGDPARLYAEEATGGVSEEVVQAMRVQMGLDKSLPEQYIIWVQELVFGGGVRKAGGFTFMEELKRRLPVTLELAFLSIAISWAIGIPGGVIAAVKQDKFADYAVRVVSITLYSIPHFWLGIMFLLVPLQLFNWSPDTLYIPFWQNPLHNLQQFMFPALVLGMTFGALILRITRSSLLEVLRSDYIRTGHSKGLANRTVLYRHALPNALIPVITVFGTQLGGILTGSIIMERIFQLPGIGRLVIDSINKREYEIVQSVVLLFVIIYVVVNLFIDVAYSLIDPRIRYR